MKRFSGQPLKSNFNLFTRTVARAAGFNSTVTDFQSPGMFTLQLPVAKDVGAYKARIDKNTKASRFTKETMPEFTAGIFGNHPRGPQLPQARWAMLKFFMPEDQEFVLGTEAVEHLRDAGGRR